MSSLAQAERMLPRRSALVWLAPVQAAAVFTVLAIVGGAQMLRAWLLSALVWVLALPILVSLEAGLVAMMLFEPLRGLIRRSQYLIVEYATQDPIHLVSPIVTVMALVVLLRSRRLTIFLATPLAGSVSLLGLIYILEIFNPLQGTLFAGFAGALFLLVPLVWFYFGQTVPEEFLVTALRLVIILGLLTSLYGVYQLVFGYPGFEQYWIENTEFYESIHVGNVERALATFSSAEEWGRYTEIGAIAAFGFAAGAKRIKARAGWLACGAALSGFVLLTGQRTAVFGLMLGVTVLVLLGGRSFKSVLARFALLALPVVLVIAFVKPPTAEEMWSKGDDQTVSTLLLHTQRGTLEPVGEESLQERFKNWSYLLTSVIPSRPLGAGLGAGNLGQRRFNSDYDYPPIDNSIIQLAIACGIPGALLFISILSRTTWLAFRQARRTPPDDPSAPVARMLAAIISALVLNSVFGLTFTIYSIAPLAWLMIGRISSNSVRQHVEA